MNNLANKINAVWDVFTKSSNGVTQTSYERNPEQELIIESKQIILENIGLKFNVPQLPFLQDTTVKLSLNDKSRGVSDNYIYLSDQDLSAPCAAIVITELPLNLQNLNDSLNAAFDMQNNSANKAGIKIDVFQMQSPKFGTSLEIFVYNRKGTAMFPTSTYRISQDLENPTLGISRFSFFDKKLIEWSLIVPISVNSSEEQVIEYSRQIMNDFWSNLDVI